MQSKLTQSIPEQQFRSYFQSKNGDMLHSSVGKQEMWQSIQKKNQYDQSINSEQSLESNSEQQIEYVRDRTLTVNNNVRTIIAEEDVQIIQQERRVPTEDMVLNTETYEDQKILPNNDVQLFTNLSQPRNSILPYKQQPQKLQPFQFENSIVNTSYVTSKNKYNSKHQAYVFHYDRIGDQQSIVIPKEIKFPLKYIFYQTILPLILVFILYICIMIIQTQISQYCFIEDIACDSYWIRLWSYFKQQLLFKLAMIFCKGHILYQLTIGNRLMKQKHRRPLMEYSVLVMLALITDFIMIFWVGFNDDWLFIVYVNIIGVVVFFNSFRMKTWPSNIRKGSSFIMYDICIMALLSYCFWIVPAIYSKLESHKRVAAPEYFMFIYPLIDLMMEIFIDLIMHFTRHCEIYIYQAQYIILGIRISTLTMGNLGSFDYWFCVVFLIVFRINNASLVLTVFIRRVIYYAVPISMRCMVSMGETKQTLKGKHAAYYEHLVWIFFYYLFCVSERSMVYYIRDVVVILDGQFYTQLWDNYERWHYQPIIVWFILLVPEIVGYCLNKSKAYDNIKYLGGCKLRFYENVCIRMLGIYLFNFAIIAPLV